MWSACIVCLNLFCVMISFMMWRILFKSASDKSGFWGYLKITFSYFWKKTYFVTRRRTVCETVLIRSHKLCQYGEIWKIISKLSLNYYANLEHCVKLIIIQININYTCIYLGKPFKVSWYTLYKNTVKMCLSPYSKGSYWQKIFFRVFLLHVKEAILKENNLLPLNSFL